MINEIQSPFVLPLAEFGSSDEVESGWMKMEIRHWRVLAYVFGTAGSCNAHHDETRSTVKGEDIAQNSNDHARQRVPECLAVLPRQPSPYLQCSPACSSCRSGCG